MDPFVGEIRAFGFDFPPMDWAQCNGQLMVIAQNTRLFSLIGTTFGGDGITTFGLPDFTGRAPVGAGSGPGLTSRKLGEPFGTATESLTLAQIPRHDHGVFGSNVLAAGVPSMVATPAANVRLSRALTLPATGTPVYSSVDAVDTELAPATIGNAGGSQPHENLQPYLGLNYCIALKGIWPQHP